MATSALWGALRSIGLVGAILLGVGVLTLSGRVPPGFMILGAVIIGLAYFAFADLLYIGRLASYVAILKLTLNHRPPLRPTRRIFHTILISRNSPRNFFFSSKRSASFWCGNHL